MKGLILNIFHKMLLGNLLIALVPLAGLFFLIDNAKNERSESVENELKLEATALAGDITRWAEMNRRILTQNSLHTVIQSMQTARQKPVLENMVNSYEWASVVYTIGFDGYIAVRSDNESTLKEDGTKADFRGDTDYFKAISNGDAFGQSVVTNSEINGPVHVLCVPVDGPALKQKDALCMESKLADIYETLVNTKLGRTGFAFLTSHENKLIASGEITTEPKEPLRDMSDYPTTDESRVNQLYTFEQDGKKRVSYAVETGLDWKLAVQQDYDEVFQSVNDAKTNALYIVVLTVAAIALLAMFFSRGLSLAIKKLTALADDYSKGHFDKVNLSLKRSDEVGDLARAIDRMGKSIRIAISKLSDK